MCLLQLLCRILSIFGIIESGHTMIISHHISVGISSCLDMANCCRWIVKMLTCSELQTDNIWYTSQQFKDCQQQMSILRSRGLPVHLCLLCDFITLSNAMFVPSNDETMVVVWTALQCHTNHPRPQHLSWCSTHFSLM